MTPPFEAIGTEAEVALALCNLGIDRRSRALMDSDGENRNPPTSPSLDRLADVACSSLPYLSQSSGDFLSPPSPYVASPLMHHVSLTAQSTNIQSSSNIANLSHLATPPVSSVASSTLRHHPPPPPSMSKTQPPNELTQAKPARVCPPLTKKAPHLDIAARRARKSFVKHRTDKRPSRKNEDTSITFEEMQRLMNVYGPLKCLRNRRTNETGKEIKATSILRKFYRWFPDFEERFVKTSNGWYMPRMGHEKEIKYREMMRRKDEKFVVDKRNDRRYEIHMEMFDNPANTDPFGMAKLH
jgi:hypothetical protein